MTSTRELQHKASTSGAAEDLPYHIELWHDGNVEKVEHVLARAATADLARAIFKAAAGEYPERRVTLRKGNRMMADSTR